MGRGFQRYAELRDAAGLTDYSVAQKAEIATSTLSAWKAGEYKPKVEKLMRIAKVLEVDITELLEEVDA